MTSIVSYIHFVPITLLKPETQQEKKKLKTVYKMCLNAAQ